MASTARAPGRNPAWRRGRVRDRRRRRRCDQPGRHDPGSAGGPPRARRELGADPAPGDGRGSVGDGRRGQAARLHSRSVPPPGRNAARYSSGRCGGPRSSSARGKRSSRSRTVVSCLRTRLRRRSRLARTHSPRSSGASSPRLRPARSPGTPPQPPLPASSGTGRRQQRRLSVWTGLSRPPFPSPEERR